MTLPDALVGPAIKGQMPGDWQSRLRAKVTPSVEKRDPDPVRTLDHIQTASISFRNMSKYGDLLVRYLEVRKEIFLDQLHWTVSTADGMEFDQYDTPFCRWIVLHQHGEVLGGVRVMPTKSSCGIYSYMIRDAQQGLLDDLPTDILFFEAPVEDNVWEATRFFVTDAVPARLRLRVQSMLFHAMSKTAVENGANYILGIVPELWSRWGRRLGAKATPIGSKFTIDTTTSQAVLFRTSDYFS
ncbi:N-acyl-L-homoserine lactone synthetase [Rhodobacteraceae bacterium D3-12]|nr:N-acyl-L-homoserine lactone synthetase [Rhodobacteraceae bacterium D3-12]